MTPILILTPVRDSVVIPDSPPPLLVPYNADIVTPLSFLKPNTGEYGVMKTLDNGFIDTRSHLTFVDPPEKEYPPPTSPLLTETQVKVT